jgi:Flp pilus assembly protein TadD
MSSWLKVLLTAVLAVTFAAQQAKAQASSTAPDSAGQPAASEHPRQSSANSGDSESPNSTPTPHNPNLAPPRSDRVQADDLGPAQGDSSSKDTEVDLTPPKDDSQEHPNSSSAVAEEELGLTPDGITELHAWDPHKAAKDIEVGNFYFRRGNYRAAEDRYREALKYKENDAVATFRLAQSLEKLGIFDDARAEYESYLKILPHGPEASQAQKAIERLKAADAESRPR